MGEGKEFIPNWPIRVAGDGPIFPATMNGMTGWAHDGYYGLFDSYSSALADMMGVWEEYCEYFRNKKSD